MSKFLNMPTNSSNMKQQKTTKLLLLSLLPIILSVSFYFYYYYYRFFQSGTNDFWLLSLLGDDNENKAFLSALCYLCHFCHLNKKNGAIYIYIKCSVLKIFLFIFYVVVEQFCNFFFCITFVYLFSTAKYSLLIYSSIFTSPCTGLPTERWLELQFLHYWLRWWSLKLSLWFWYKW